MPNPTDLAAAQDLLRRERHGTLCTLHAAHEGWPFGSVVPYAVMADGDPVVLLATIAEHAKNVSADPRVTLFVADAGAAAEPQAGARLALMARAEVAAGPTAESAGRAYFERFPEARGYLDSHGFQLYVLRTQRVRWIAGFGSMGWIERAAWVPAASAEDPLARHASGICEHMNRDHPDSLVVLARRYAGVTAAAATMVGLDVAGLDLEVAGKRVRVAFPRTVTTPEGVRQVVTSMLGHARRG